MELAGLSEYLQLLDNPSECTVENLQALMAAYPEWRPLATVDDNGATAVHHTVGVTLAEGEDHSQDGEAATSQEVANILSLLGFFVSLVRGDGQKDEAMSMAALNAFLAKKDVDGESLLHYAARGGVTTIIRHLLSVIGSGTTSDNGEVPSIPSSSSESALKRQLEAINAEASNGATPFHFAAEGGHTGALVIFMKVYNGLKKQSEAPPSNTSAPNVKRDMGGMTPVHYACSKGHLDTVKYLIEGDKTDVELPKAEGCDVFIHDNDGTTSLHYASVGGNLALIEYLVYTCGGEFAQPSLLIDSLGQTPLLFAAMGGHQKVLEALVSKFKCDPKVQTSAAAGGMTALHFAAVNKDKDMMNYLENTCGCDPSIINSDGLTAAEVLEEVLASENEGCCLGDGCTEEGHHH